jgi:acetyl esterase/lipase
MLDDAPRQRRRLPAKWLGGICFVIGAAATPFVVLGLSDMANRVQAPVAVDYAAMLPAAAQDQTCSAREAPQVDSITIEDGLKINVRTPANYDRTRAHPLLVAFPPGGFGRLASESYYSMTAAATERGFIVAFPDSRPLSKSMVELYSKVADAVAAQWCIDRERVVFLGHSDGASASYGISLLEGGALQPRASLWWWKCFGCTPDKFAKVAPHCVEAEGCQSRANLVFCETDAEHVTAPVIGDFELDFLRGVDTNAKKG